MNVAMVLIGSFILHALSIFAIIILYLRQNQYAQSEKAMQKLQQDVEAVLQSFLMEIQEENKQLAATITAVKNKDKRYPDEEKIKKSGENFYSHSSNAPSKTSVEIEKAMIYPSVSSAKKAYQIINTNKEEKNTDAYEPPISDVKDQLDISTNIYENKNEKLSFKAALESQLKQEAVKTTEERAIDMMKDGYNIEEIAKTLGRGKTEIELLLKFHS